MTKIFFGSMHETKQTFKCQGCKKDKSACILILKPKAKMSLWSIYTVGPANDKNMQGVLWYDD